MARVSSSQADPVTPSSPWREDHSSRTDPGASMLVIQLIVVPPPTQPPASIWTEPSQVLRSP